MPADSELLKIIVSAQDQAAKRIFRDLNKELKTTKLNLTGIGNSYKYCLRVRNVIIIFWIANLICEIV